MREKDFISFSQPYIYYIKIFEYFQMDEGFSRFRIFPRLDITVSSIAIWGTTYNTYPLCQFLVIPENFLGDFIFLLALLQSS